MADKKGKQMTSIRVSREAQVIIKLIKKQYRGTEGIITQDDAFLHFMLTHHPDIYNEAMEVAAVQRKLDEFFEDDE